MAELTYTLGEHPQIKELLSVLEQNNLQKQKEEVQALVGYMDSLEGKLAQMMEDMKEMRLEVGKLHDKGIRARCAQLVTATEGKIQQTRTMVFTAKANLISSAGRMVQTFRGKGRSALRQAVQALRIPAVLSRMERGFSHAGRAMEQCAGKLDVIRAELHQAGSHMKSAGRALVGKEVQQAQELEADKGVLAKLRGLFLSCGKIFSGMERGAGRLAEKAGGERFSVKSELRGLRAAPAAPHRQAAGKEQAR